MSKETQSVPKMPIILKSLFSWSSIPVALFMAALPSFILFLILTDKKGELGFGLTIALSLYVCLGMWVSGFVISVNSPNYWTLTIDEIGITMKHKTNSRTCEWDNIAWIKNQDRRKEFSAPSGLVVFQKKYSGRSPFFIPDTFRIGRSELFQIIDSIRNSGINNEQ